jgi:uncharacterized protein (DUF983 family)
MTEVTHMPSSIEVGIRSCCPRCGEGRLFGGFIDLAPKCDKCGLDYGFADSGDGPAVFIMMIAGFVIVGLVLWVEFTWSPPLGSRNALDSADACHDRRPHPPA